MLSTNFDDTNRGKLKMAGKMLKGTLLVSLMVVMALGAPAMTRAQSGSTNPLGSISDPSQLQNMFNMIPGMFGAMGGAAAVVGQVLGIILGQLTNLTSRQTIDGFYVLNATIEKNSSRQVDLGTGEVQTYYADWDYVANYESQIEAAAAPSVNEQVGYPFCRVTRTGTGTLTINRTVGMSVVFGIWDPNGSLIRTIQRIVTTVQNMMHAMETAISEGTTDPSSDSRVQKAMQSAIEAAFYMLIHINDIITGDELIMFNPISYEYTRISGSYGEIHEWFVDVWDVNSQQTRYANINSSVTLMNAWRSDSNYADNGFMKWLVDGACAEDDYSTEWSTFSFDLIQIWLKKFYVSIDLQPLVEAIRTNTMDSLNPASVLKNIDIDIYLIWHHFLGGVFYKDLNANNEIDIVYKNVTTGNNTQLFIDGQPVQRPDSTEVTHFIGLKAFAGNNVEWLYPTIKNGGVSWGVQFNLPKVFWTPVGMDPEARVRNNPLMESTLDYIYLGFTFKPGVMVELRDVDGSPTGLTGQDCSVKLDQRFGEWNPAPNAIDSDVSGCDFAIVYASTLLHVHFTADVMAHALGLSEEEQQEVYDTEASKSVSTNTNVNVSKDLRFGRDARSNSPMVGRVDIAGLEYSIEDPLTSTVHTGLSPTTQIIPLGLFTLDAQAGMDYSDLSMQAGGFTASATLGIEFSVMLYSVNYPAFSDYCGGEIIHDPTFSIFMTFDAETYWAIILLVGVVALVGVAAILITRAKNNR